MNDYHLPGREEMRSEIKTPVGPVWTNIPVVNSWQWILMYSQWLLPLVLLTREYGHEKSPAAPSQPKLGRLWMH